MFVALLRTHFKPRYDRAKMSQKHIYAREHQLYCYIRMLLHCVMKSFKKFCCHSEPTATGSSVDEKSRIDAPSHGHNSYQSSLDSFLPQLHETEKSFDIDTLAEKVASKVLQKLNSGEKLDAPVNPLPATSSDASNLLEYFELTYMRRTARCRTCSNFLSSPVSFSSSFRRPSGKASGSLPLVCFCRKKYSLS